METIGRRFSWASLPLIAATIDGTVGKVECEEFLGGLLKSYHRTAA